MTAIIATPDNDFKMVTAVSELDEVKISEIMEFGKLTENIE